jgi:hypothetical protein
VVSYLHPLHTEDTHVPGRHGCVHEDVLAGVGCSIYPSINRFKKGV